jgi:hypothetical protein
MPRSMCSARVSMSNLHAVSWMIFADRVQDSARPAAHGQCGMERQTYLHVAGRIVRWPLGGYAFCDRRRSGEHGERGDNVRNIAG